MKDIDTDIDVLAAHPAMSESGVNRPLMPSAAVTRVHLRDLHASYPDYSIDVAAEQIAMARAKLVVVVVVVLLHPIQGYSMPALQKMRIDEVLTHCWAYEEGGNKLQGKDLWLVATTGGPETSYHPQSYNRYFFDAFLPPYEQTAALCGMRFLPPLILHKARNIGQGDLDRHVATFSQRLQTYPRWAELDDLAPFPAHAADDIHGTDRLDRQKHKPTAGQEDN